LLEECRLCGSSDLALWVTDGRHRDLNYYRCMKCGLWNYDLSLGLDQTQYTHTYVSPDDAGYKSNVHNAATWAYLSKRLPVPGRLFDIGCGNGSLMVFAREGGWEVRGLELSADMAARVRAVSQLDVQAGSFPDAEVPRDQSYDVVVLRHVLEHLPDSIGAMRRINAMLKPGGHALLEFPNTGSASYRYKRWLKNRGLNNSKYAEDWRPGHCNEFCREAFEYLLSRTGFELVDWGTYSNSPLANAVYRIFPIGSNARALVRKGVP